MGIRAAVIAVSRAATCVPDGRPLRSKLLMANEKKKYVWLGVAGAALATLLVYVSIFWPPVPRSWVQGAIGKRDVYRQEMETDKDIGVAGTVTVTVDDMLKFLQSPEFKSLAGNA